MLTSRIHAPYDRYSVAFPEVGITYLAEVDWPLAKVKTVSHSHREIQTLWILSGKMGLETAQRRIDPASGVCYIIPSDLQHTVVQVPENPEVSFLDIRLAADDATLSRFLARFGELIYVADVRALNAAANALREALALRGDAKIARLQAILWEMVSGLSSAQASPPAPHPGSHRLRIAETMIRENLAQALSIEALAHAAGVSRSQLTRLYKQHLGMGPAQRLREMRIEKARELMAGSTLTIKEVAHVCGFVCPNHFCRVFLQTVGATPTQYRLRSFDPAILPNTH